MPGNKLAHDPAPEQRHRLVVPIGRGVLAAQRVIVGDDTAAEAGDSFVGAVVNMKPDRGHQMRFVGPLFLRKGTILEASDQVLNGGIGTKWGIFHAC